MVYGKSAESLKTKAELWSDELRLNLVELSISDYPRFRASDFEFHLPRPSYSVYTLEKLRETYPDREFYFIIGSDNWERFGRWYQSERIIKENQLLIYPRPGFPVKEEELPETVRLVHSPVFEISSTFIREALSAGKDIRYFLHPRAWEAIKKIIYAFEYIKIHIRQNITDNLLATLIIDNQLFIDANVNAKKDNNKKSYPKSVVCYRKSYQKSV